MLCSIISERQKKFSFRNFSTWNALKAKKDWLVGSSLRRRIMNVTRVVKNFIGYTKISHRDSHHSLPESSIIRCMTSLCRSVSCEHSKISWNRRLVLLLRCFLSFTIMDRHKTDVTIVNESSDPVKRRWNLRQTCTIFFLYILEIQTLNLKYVSKYICKAYFYL